MCRDHKQERISSGSFGKAPTAALVLLALCVALGISPIVKGAIPTYAQSEAWSKPIMLSIESVTSWFPDVAVDTAGRVHVVWNSDCSRNLDDLRKGI